MGWCSPPAAVFFASCRPVTVREGDAWDIPVAAGIAVEGGVVVKAWVVASVAYSSRDLPERTVQGALETHPCLQGPILAWRSPMAQELNLLPCI